MALFLAADHADNPPSTWQVVKVGRTWQVQTKDGDVLAYGQRTKRDAEALLASGFYVDLYEKEHRWYAGEHVAGWKPYTEVKGAR